MGEAACRSTGRARRVQSRAAAVAGDAAFPRLQHHGSRLANSKGRGWVSASWSRLSWKRASAPQRPPPLHATRLRAPSSPFFDVNAELHCRRCVGAASTAVYLVHTAICTSHGVFCWLFAESRCVLLREPLQVLMIPLHQNNCPVVSLRRRTEPSRIVRHPGHVPPHVDYQGSWRTSSSARSNGWPQPQFLVSIEYLHAT